MNMTIAIILIMLGAGVGLWATTRTRTARLAQMARLNGCRFDKEKDTVTTELTAGRLEFLRYFSSIPKRLHLVGQFGLYARSRR